MTWSRDPMAGLSATQREILLRRAERIRDRPEDRADTETYWVAEFSVGEETFALPLDVMRGVVPLGVVTPVPLAAPHVIGILRYQGEIISALSLASMLEGRSMRRDSIVLLVVDPGWGYLTALDCEQIPQVIGLDRARVAQSRERAAGAFVEVTTEDLRQVHLIDLQLLLDRRNVEKNRGG